MKNLLWVLLGVLLTLAGIFLLGLPVWLLALGIAALCFLLVFSFLCRGPTHILNPGKVVAKERPAALLLS